MTPLGTATKTQVGGEGQRTGGAGQQRYHRTLASADVDQSPIKTLKDARLTPEGKEETSPLPLSSTHLTD